MSTPQIEKLKKSLPGLLAKANAFLAESTTENRAPSAEEQKNFDDTMALYEATERQVASLERAQAAAGRLEAAPRLTKPPDPGEDGGTAPPAGGGRAHITGGDRPGASKGTGGFTTMGEFALAVRMARLGQHDPRLRQIQAAAATTAGQEAVGADGGYAVPPDFRATILKKVQGEESLLAMTDQYTTSANEVSLPTDETTPWQSSGGIQVSWLGEGTAITQSKPSLQNFLIRTQKLAALVPVSDELLSDAQVIDGYINEKVPDKMMYALNDAIVNGSGAGKPAGILGAASLVTQAAEGGQTAATINYANITKMWSRMYAPSRKNGVWIINQDVEPQLFALTVTGGSPALPAYLPPGGLSDSPYGRLLGRPVLYSEACQPVGTVGDILFVDPKQYATAVKAGGIRTDMSVHLFFDADQTAFRVIMRVGGAPWWKSSITRAKSSLTLSWAVALAAR